MPEDQARIAVGRLSALPLRLERPAALSDRAWDVSRTLGWAKTSDAEYVALVQLLDCPLVTLDARLARGAGHLARIISPADVDQSVADASLAFLLAAEHALLD